MQKLKCPNPECDNHRKPFPAGGDGMVWIACDCGLEGPYKTTQAEAIAAWERSTFTKEPDNG